MALPLGARMILASAAVLACAAPGLARDDDVEFALALADRGYEDLANKEVERMLKGANTSDARENAAITKCQLLRRAALLVAGNDKSEPAEVRAKFTAAIAEFESFLKSYPASRLSSEAEFNVGNLMKDFAYYLSTSKDKFPAKDQEAVAKEASKTFEDAVNYLRKIKDREEEKDKDLPEEDESKYFDRNIAWFYLCQAMHDRALILPPGDAMRLQHLTQADQETQLLLEQTEGGVFGYYAGKLLGNIHWHRAQMAQGFAGDDLKQALEWFEMPLGAADIPDLDQWPAVRNVMFEAAYEFGEMCNKVGTHEGVNYTKGFVDRITQMETKQPSIRKERFGLQALVEKAKAMAILGMHAGAVKLLSDISNEAKDAPLWGGAVDQMAKKGLNEVLASLPPESSLTVGPDVLYKAAEGSRVGGEYGRALRTYQATIVACENEPDADRRKSLLEEYWTRCWARINDCYAFGLRRHLEAFLAADVPVQKYLADRRTDEDMAIGTLAQNRMYALQELVKTAPKEKQAEYGGRLKAARDLLADKFPWISTGTVYGVAVVKLSEANTLAAQGEKEKAAAKYNEAIADFRKIGEKEDIYLMAQARIGECFVGMGKAQEALTHLDATLAKHKANDAKDAPPHLRQAFGVAVFWKAGAHDALKAFDKALEALADFEMRFQGAKLENFEPRVRYLRVRSFVELKRGPEAAQEVEILRKQHPDHGYTSQAAVIAANELLQRAARTKATDRKAAQDLSLKALDLYDFWLRRTAAPTADNYTFVGKLHNEAGSGERAAECWTKALDMYQQAGNAELVEDLTVLLASLLVNQKRFAEALPKFEVLFIKTPGDVLPLRALYEAFKRKPSNVTAPDHEKKMKAILEDVEKQIAKDPEPSVAALAPEVKRAAANLDVELVIRAFADKPEQRRAIARASVLALLGHDAAMPPELRTAVFELVNRRPELMSNIARCYEELAGVDPRNPIRAINLYVTLLDSARDDFEEPKAPGSRYSEKWFGWKYSWVKVSLTTGIQYKADAFLKVACDIVKGMGTLGELEKAEKEREGFKKEFEALRDQADTALRGLGKGEGCK